MSQQLVTRNRIQSTYSEIKTELYISDCPECGIIFGMPRELEQRRRDDGGSVFCPNGHAMGWHETKEDRLKKELAEAKREAERYERQRDAALDNAQTERRKAAAARGQLTKMRNRVARGVCPKQSCKRSFDKMADHVRECHPELLDDLSDELDGAS